MTIFFVFLFGGKLVRAEGYLPRQLGKILGVGGRLEAQLGPTLTPMS